MKKLIKMPSIEQFRNAIHNITKAARFDGLNEDGVAVYNQNPLPILTATGTVKLHGTNASVCYNARDGLWVQSKKNIINVENDNAGFAFFVEVHQDLFKTIFANIGREHGYTGEDETITIFGEWAGIGIQKGVGVSELEKAVYIFGVKISPNSEGIDAFWLDQKDIRFPVGPNIYNIIDFKTFNIVIDFNNPLLSNNEMVKMVQSVEDECPVSKQFGVSGIGEGIVFTVKFKDKTYRWKMKGDKHAGESKVKTADKVDDAKLQLIIDIVEKVTPEWRLTQMYDETFDVINGGCGDIKKTGDYLRAVIKDIMKEELIVISEAGLAPKDINSSIAKKARSWFMAKLNKEFGIE